MKEELTEQADNIIDLVMENIEIITEQEYDKQEHKTKERIYIQLTTNKREQLRKEIEYILTVWYDRNR